MSSKFFTNRHDQKTNPKVNNKNAPGSRQNFKKAGVRKTGRGK